MLFIKKYRPNVTSLNKNNPIVGEGKDDVPFVDGSAEETLNKVRDLVHEGYELISHPLAVPTV